MMTDIIKIRNVYDEGADEEYLRLIKSPLHEAEWTLTTELIDEYISAGDKVLDIGAGPGRYSEYLALKGCQVGLVDISKESLNRFHERVDESVLKQVIFSRESSATDLTWVEAASFDCVLAMGPLYHLVSEPERTKVLDGCRRVLRPDGILVAAFISPYQALAHLFQNPDDAPDIETVKKLLDDGITYHRGMEQWRCWPQTAQLMIKSMGFDILRTRNLEGIGCFLGRHHSECISTQEGKKALFNMLRLTCEIPDLLGATWHFVCVAKRN